MNEFDVQIILKQLKNNDYTEYNLFLDELTKTFGDLKINLLCEPDEKNKLRVDINSMVQHIYDSPCSGFETKGRQLELLCVADIIIGQH